MNRMSKLAAVAALAIGMNAPQVLAQVLTEKEEAKLFNPVRGVRFCEIFAGDLDPAGFADLIVWNTTGLNTCPSSLWQNITTQSAAQQLGVQVAILNGQRMWTMDRIMFRDIEGYANAGGLTFQDVASLRFADPNAAGGAYDPLTIARNNEYIWEAGKPAFLLLDSNKNQTWIMQTYARQNCTGCPQESYEENQDFTDLYDLGERLTLPPGWKYVPVVLTEEFQDSASPNCTGGLDCNPLFPQGEYLATIMRDELDNVYTQATNPQGAAVDLSYVLIKKSPPPPTKPGNGNGNGHGHGRK